MRLLIRTHALEVSPEGREYLERRLGYTLGRLAPRVRSVTAYLSDANGPRGGVDKHCRIVARLTGAGLVTVEDRDADLHALIDRSAERLARSVSRWVERHRSHRVGPPRRP